MILHFDRSSYDFSPLNQVPDEWIETNGLGGWSGSTISGMHTRRYHGLLVAATKPPAERMVVLSHLEETIIKNDTRFELGCHLYAEDVVYPQGFKFISEFQKGLFPEWTYSIGEIVIRKTCAMIYGENTTIVVYELLNGDSFVTLELLPLIAARFYHSLQHEGPHLHWNATFIGSTFQNRPDGDINLYIKVPGGKYTHDPKWYKNFTYLAEKNRGLNYEEDLLNHGTFELVLEKGTPVGIIISTDDPGNKEAIELLKKEEGRRNRLLNGRPRSPIVKQLLLAADQFIVSRDRELKTIIAGYHWFTDWGRDTMISLPGLCLVTGRQEEAKKILTAFAESINQGMLPNRFQDDGNPPEYNNVDATLWYFIAIHHYIRYTDDHSFVEMELLPALKDIITWHLNGTRFNIHMDDDALLFEGEPGQQLTWMDARIGNWVITPRMGKPVEIEALWYNVLKIYASILNKVKAPPNETAFIEEKAEHVKSSFLEKYWFEEGNYLFDNIDENGKPDKSIRPNQLFAISLPYPLIGNPHAGQVLEVIDQHLLTPVGLRSLSPSDDNYIGVYSGDIVKRDSSYHQGTVWSWLLGPYIDALVKVKDKKGRDKASVILERFSHHLQKAGLGTISEVFDGNFPHLPGGCIAQAWSVGEILRVIIEYDLTKLKQKKKEKAG